MVATDFDSGAFGGAIGSIDSKLKVFDSIFKKNKAIATASGVGRGGAIDAFSQMFLSSALYLS